MTSPQLLARARTRSLAPPHAAPTAAATTSLRRPTRGIALLVTMLAVAVLASLAIGATTVPISTVVEAFTDFVATDTDHLVVRELRLPRTVLALIVGAALGVAGALMQAITRNPLADPGILGVNAGAAGAVVIAIWGFGITATSGLVWFAFAGAAITSVVVYLLGSLGRGGPTPVRLALAGTALSAFLLALTRAVTLLDTNTLDQFRFWAVGSLSGRDAEVTRNVAGFVVAGLVMAVAASRSLNALALGEDAAAALGVRINRTRAVTGLAIVLCCGAAVAAVGPIGFVGLVVPHAMRVWFGPDQRWLVPACALGGAVVLVTCDVLGRLVARPGEVQVGIMTAALGGPVFVVLVRRMRSVRG